MITKKNKSKAERTRELIIEKAATVFNKKGYAGTSLTDLLKVTKLTKGSLYGNFENKDEIAVAAFEYNYNKLKTGTVAAAAAKENSADKLLAFCKYYREKGAKLFSDGGCALLNTAIDADDNMPLLHRKVHASVKEWKSFIESIIKTGKAKKEIRKEVDPNLYSTLLIALIEGGIFLAKTTNDNSRFHATLERIELMINDEIKM